VAAQGKSLTLEWLPACAPELNPVEHIWGYVKRNELPNLYPRHLGELSSGLRRAPTDAPTPLSGHRILEAGRAPCLRFSQPDSNRTGSENRRSNFQRNQGHPPDGSGVVYRLGCTYVTANLSATCAASHGIGSLSADFKVFGFASDWNCQLGSVSGS